MVLRSSAGAKSITVEVELRIYFQNKKSPCVQDFPVFWNGRITLCSMTLRAGARAVSEETLDVDRLDIFSVATAHESIATKSDHSILSTATRPYSSNSGIKDISQMAFAAILSIVHSSHKYPSPALNLYNQQTLHLYGNFISLPKGSDTPSSTAQSSHLHPPYKISRPPTWSSCAYA